MEAKVSRELDRLERDRRVAAEMAREERALEEFLFLEKAFTTTSQGHVDSPRSPPG